MQNHLVSSQLNSLKYLMSLIPAVLSIAGNLMGGYLAFANIIFLFVILVLADIVLPSKTDNSTNNDPAIPDGILFAGVILHTTSIVSLLYSIHSEILTGIFIYVAAISTGLTSGLLGITAAHELIHRNVKWLRGLGIWNLMLVNYGHFYTEHRLVHHPKVGTPDDPATAKYGESLYKFIVRTIPAQWLSALQTDARLQQKKKKFKYSLGNFTIMVTIIQLTILIVLYIVFGYIIFLACLIQSILAIFLLEYVNYIEHYGLVREGRQRVGKHHSWQSDAITSRFTLFELTRHPDHHLLAYKPYHTLQSHEESPILPYGYFGMFYLSLFPPLFFKIMHERLAIVVKNN